MLDISSTLVDFKWKSSTLMRNSGYCLVYHAKFTNSVIIIKINLTFYNNFGSILVLRVRKNQNQKIKNMNNLNERIENFLQLVNQNMHNHYRNNFPSTYAETSADHQYVVADTGRKFLRIASNDRNGNIRSVYCFIALTDGNTKSMGSYSAGDIMKPATWKAPAKHSRGSVLADDFGLSCVGPYGVDYLTRKGGGYKFSPLTATA